MPKKKPTLDITRLSGLKWEKEEACMNREVIDTCDFCACDIYDNEDYWTARSPVAARESDLVCCACKDCGTKAGLEW